MAETSETKLNDNAVITYGDCKEVIYIPGEVNICATVHPVTKRCFYSNDTIEETIARYPGAILTTWDDALQQIAKAEKEKFVKPVSRTTKDKFWEMLEVLPPMKWKTHNGIESFMVCEALTGVIHDIYATDNMGNYFNLTDSKFLSAEDIANRVIEFRQNESKTENN